MIISICIFIAILVISLILLKRKKEKYNNTLVNKFVFRDVKTGSVQDFGKWNKKKYIESNKRKLPLGLQEEN